MQMIFAYDVVIEETILWNCKTLCIFALEFKDPMTAYNNIAKSHFPDVFFSKKTDGDCLSNTDLCARHKRKTTFPFTGKERDRETGFSYFGARYYDSDLSGLFISVDPMSDKYPSVSPYAYCAWNPMILTDPKGDTINISCLSENQLDVFSRSVNELKHSPLFEYYYGELIKSPNTYIIQAGPGYGGEGSFTPTNNAISANLDNLHALSQELFHAYQSDGCFYTPADASVRETEGDLVSLLVMDDLGRLSSSYGDWIKTFNNYRFDDSHESLLDDNFILDFDKMVDDRINYYLNTNNPPKLYIQPNSHTGPKALLAALNGASIQYQQWKSDLSSRPLKKLRIIKE